MGVREADAIRNLPKMIVQLTDLVKDLKADNTYMKEKIRDIQKKVTRKYGNTADITTDES